MPIVIVEKIRKWLLYCSVGILCTFSNTCVLADINEEERTINNRNNMVHRLNSIVVQELEHRGKFITGFTDYLKKSVSEYDCLDSDTYLLDKKYFRKSRKECIKENGFGFCLNIEWRHCSSRALREGLLAYQNEFTSKLGDSDIKAILIAESRQKREREKTLVGNYFSYFSNKVFYPIIFLNITIFMIPTVFILFTLNYKKENAARIVAKVAQAAYQPITRESLCQICLNSFTPNSAALSLACGHALYHASCTQKWFETSGKYVCSLCEQPAYSD